MTQILPANTVAPTAPVRAEAPVDPVVRSGTRSAGGEPPPPLAPPPVAPPPSTLSRVVGSMTTLVAIMLLTFVAELALIGPIRHAREQQVRYDEFRVQLANATAPTGQLDFQAKPVLSGAPVAVLAVPSLGLREVVLEGSTSGVLMSGIGHRRDTPLPGQQGVSIIVGRQSAYGGPFANLGQLAKGMQIAVTTAQGSSMYQVTGSRLAGDRAFAPLPDAAQLTLISVVGRAYAAEQVLRVDAKLITEAFPSPDRPIGAASLRAAELPLAGDRGVLVPLLLWCQLLLVASGVLAWIRSIWSFWPTWIVGVPVLGGLGLQVSHLLAQMLPNLL